MLKITLSARGTKRLQFFTALWLWLEAILIWCGPVFALALLFANLAVWGAITALPPAAQFILSACFWSLAAWLLVRGARKVLWPNFARVKSRLERAGAILHQPLQTLADQPMRSSPISDALWQHHQFSAAHDLARLRWPKLRADYAPRDPMALRWLMLLLLLSGVLQHGALAMPRLSAAFFPGDFSGLAALGPSEFHLYITPPGHTGIKPLYFNGKAKPPAPLSIPQGSKLWLRVVGGKMTPEFAINKIKQKLARSGEYYFTLEKNIIHGDRLVLRQGIFTLLDAEISVQPNQPPVIEKWQLAELPQGQWRVTFCARDLYGMTNANLNWQRGAQSGNAPLVVSGAKLCDAQIISVAAEALAGEEVEAWLSVENNAGLKTESEKREAKLPAYVFENPLAAKLAAARHAYQQNPQEPKPLMDVLAELRRAKLPVGLYLALQNSLRELEAGRAQGALADVWQIALRIEEGSYADIAAIWRATRKALLDQLPNWNLSEETLLRQINEAADAWDAYAPAFGYDGAQFDGVWENIRALVRAGNRRGVEKLLRQFDADPGALLDESGWPQPDSEKAEALTEIRQRLKDPQLTPNERDYLERLLQP